MTLELRGVTKRYGSAKKSGDTPGGPPRILRLPASAGVSPGFFGTSYGERLVLDNISLLVEPGQVAALCGPSGCGKTTLLRIVAGLEAAAGEVLLGGAPAPPEPWGRGVAMVFQDAALWPHMTAAENVAFAMRDGGPEPLFWLNEVGAAHLAAQFPDRFSGGEARRVAVARALAARQPVWLLDEPLASLDRVSRHIVEEVLVRRAAETRATVLWVTHDEAEARRAGSRLWWLEDGRLRGM